MFVKQWLKNGIVNQVLLKHSKLNRCLSTTSESISIDDDSPVEMENPYKSPIRRCVLCGIPIDYKNAQLLSQFVSTFSGLQYSKKMTRKFE